GFLVADRTTTLTLQFGAFGDNLIPGPWEDPNVTSPAIARLYSNSWIFYVLKHDGGIRTTYWGHNGDIPMPADYDGDGVFDVAVYRPSERALHVICSSDSQARKLPMGSGTADYSVRGDFTGDGRDDLVFWEPLGGMFWMMRSDAGVAGEAAALATGDLE